MPARIPEESFEDLYENAPCGHVSMSVGGNIFRANATLAQWLGYPTSELTGRSFQDLLSVGTRLFYETHAAPLLHLHGSFAEVALELKTVAGEKLPVFANAVGLRDESGNPYARLALVRSTERRRYERELVEARRQSEALELATQNLLRTERGNAVLRDQFIAVLGHDLRNPLAGIIGGVRLLKREPLSDKSRMILEMLQGSANRMSGLIDNVMDFARGRLGGGFALARQSSVLLEPVLRQVIEELRVDAPGRVIEATFQLDRPIDCDPARIGQMVSNLVGNALNHGAADQPVRVQARADGTELTICVANSGAPIPPDILDRLFHPFVRGEARGSKQGLGLGLYIASEIAKAHGGTLTVVSSGAETRFTFRMPVG